MLKFITRTRPAIFKEVIYHVQVSTLLDMGFLSKLNYYPMNPMGWNELNLKGCPAAAGPPPRGAASGAAEAQKRKA